MSVISCIKHVGQTPLEVIEALRETKKWTKKDVKLSYAGRLDPMAHGLMIVLKDEECYNQHKWHNMNKTYEFKLLTSDFAYWNEKERKWDIENGIYNILVGSSSSDIRLIYPNLEF